MSKSAAITGRPEVKPDSIATRTHTKRIPWMRLHIVVISLLYLVLSTEGIIEFTIWPSVQEFLGALDPYLYFQKTWDEIFLAPWGVRTGVAMPSLILAELTSLSQEQTFGLQCSVTMILTVMLINRTATATFGTRLSDHELAVALFIYSLSYFMNGRLCSAFLGSAWMMKVHLEWIRGTKSTIKVLLTNVAALTLMTVSSGTFMVGFATVFLWFYYALFNLRENAIRTRMRIRLEMFFGMLPVIFLAAVQSSLFLAKLFDYYESDMIEVLYHGYGDYIQKYLPGLTAAEFFVFAGSTLPIAALLVYSIVRRLSRLNAYLFCSVLLTLCMGACGWSTMLTNTPSIVLGGVLVLCQPRHASLVPSSRRQIPGAKFQAIGLRR